MPQHKHKLVLVIVAIATMFILVMSTGLWPPPDVPVAYAVQCVTNCETITNITTASLTLNGSDQTVPYTLVFNLINTGAVGWNVTITSTTFKTVSPVNNLATTASSVTAVTAVCTSGQICATMPTNVVAYPVAVPAGKPAPTAVKFYNSASTTGVGTFDISTTVNITIPANVYAGSYTSTITLAYVSGP